MRTQAWHYPGRFECLLCHNANAGYTLGFRTTQLNCTGAGMTNQIGQLMDSGYLSAAPASVNLLARLAPAEDVRWSREWRVRSYLNANCVQCHRPGGPTWAAWDARWQVPLDDTGLLYGSADVRPGGQADYYIVSPGNAQNSSLCQRLIADPPLHMPPLATSETNQAAVDLLSAWITNDLPSYRSYSSWATNYFSDLTVPAASPTADPDGDGLSNEAEYLLRQSPLDPAPGWKPQMILSPAGEVRIRFLRLANRCFTIEELTDWKLSIWQPVDIPENAPFYGATDEWAEVPLPLTRPVGLFRISVSAP